MGGTISKETSLPAIWHDALPLKMYGKDKGETINAQA
jgi:hypothetical protein